MKSKFGVIAVLLFIGLVFFLIAGLTCKQSKVSITQVDDKSFLANRERQLHNDRQTQYNREIQNDDLSHEYYREGNSCFVRGEYQEAAKAYQKSYSMGGLSRAISGMKLAMTYEKLGMHKEAILQIDTMIQKHHLSDLGIQDAISLKEKILAESSRTKKQKNGSSLYLTTT